MSNKESSECESPSAIDKFANNHDSHIDENNYENDNNTTSKHRVRKIGRRKNSSNNSGSEQQFSITRQQQQLLFANALASVIASAAQQNNHNGNNIVIFDGQIKQQLLAKQNLMFQQQQQPGLQALIAQEQQSTQRNSQKESNRNEGMPKQQQIQLSMQPSATNAATVATNMLLYNNYCRVFSGLKSNIAASPLSEDSLLAKDQLQTMQIIDYCTSKDVSSTDGLSAQHKAQGLLALLRQISSCRQQLNSEQQGFQQQNLIDNNFDGSVSPGTSTTFSISSILSSPKNYHQLVMNNDLSTPSFNEKD